ncbi:MAG TPA: DUF1178 family protein [Roseiarcus sp.]|jgi:hypothetical protein
MIKYALSCENAHSFESWFPNSESYDVQARRGLIACPECGSARVSKAIMAPAIVGGDKSRPRQEATAAPVALLDERQQRLREIARQLRQEIIANSDDVGAKFPEEARAIHDGDAPARSIRGQATAEEARALIEDGVGVLPLPFLPEEFN